MRGRQLGAAAFRGAALVRPPGKLSPRSVPKRGARRNRFARNEKT